jgi:mRNA interferase YafQ
MTAIYETSQFRKDIKKLIKQGKEIEKLKMIIRRIATGEPLESRNRDHALSGPLKGSRDCHIEPDWLLIYRTDGESLFLERTGSHSDLFKK